MDLNLRSAVPNDNATVNAANTKVLNFNILVQVNSNRRNFRLDAFTSFRTNISNNYRCTWFRFI